MASPSSSIDPARRPPLCAAAPILNSLLPLIAGILLADQVPALAVPAALVVLACLLIPVPSRQRGIRAVFVLSLAGGILLGHLRASPAHPLWSELPPREVRGTIRVDELFNARKPGRIAGTATLLKTDIPHDTVQGKAAAFYLESGPLGERDPGLGEVLECRAVLEYLPAREAHDDYQMYLLSRDIFITLGRGEVLCAGAPPPPVERLRLIHYRNSQDILTSGCDSPGDPGNVLASMLLGNRSLLSDERMERFRHTGSYHLFAVSGLHVGSVALCLHLLCGLLRLPAAWRIVPVLAGTWAYVWLTGASPSAVRAGIMISCIGLARCLLRQPHIFPALALSAWLVLLLDPAQLFHLGFQLSYSVVGMILLVGLPLARHWREGATRPNWHRSPLPWWRHRLRKVKGATIDLVCVSVSASLGSMPLIIQHFDLFTPAGVLFGILLNPLATLTVMAGCVALLCGPLQAGVVGGWIALSVWPVIRLMEWLLDLCLKLPGAFSQRSWPWPHTGTCLVGLVLAVAWLMQHLRQQGQPLPAASYLLPHLIVLASLALLTVQT